MNLMNLADVTRDIKRADLRQMYYYLRLTRALEDRITALYRQGRIVGGVYTSHGMEAISVGYASALERDDVIAPFHRDMGAFLIRGFTPGEVLAQYLGKRTGPSKGKDGNVHMGDLNRGVISFVSHLADNLPVATGIALAFKIRGERRVTFTGTGTVGMTATREKRGNDTVWVVRSDELSSSESMTRPIRFTRRGLPRARSCLRRASGRG